MRRHAEIKLRIESEWEAFRGRYATSRSYDSGNLHLSGCIAVIPKFPTMQHLEKIG